MVDLDHLIFLHNEQRKKTWIWKVPNLEKNKKLMIYAQDWALYMAINNDLKHGQLRNILVLGFSLVGENIASGQTSPEKVMDSWIKNIGHRNNIMNKNFTDIGCGYALSRNKIPYWCVCFGKSKFQKK